MILKKGRRYRSIIILDKNLNIVINEIIIAQIKIFRNKIRKTFGLQNYKQTLAH